MHALSSTRRRCCRAFVAYQLRELSQLGATDTGHRPIRHPRLSPMNDIISPADLGDRQGVSHMLRGRDEKIDDVLAPPVHHRGYWTVIQIVEPAANQRKSVSNEVFDRRCKIESAIEPGLDRMLVRREHVRQMVRRQRTEMIVNHLPRR